MRSLVLAVAVLVAATFAAGAGASAGSRATLTVRSSSYGSILFDGKGRALYAFTRDRRGAFRRAQSEL